MRIKTMGWFLNMFGMIGITLAPVGIYIKEGHLSERTINHEKIHWKQQMEMLIIPFYIWYLIEWLFRIILNGRQAYIKLLFEKEAYDNDDNPDYLTTRKRFAWL